MIGVLAVVAIGVLALAVIAAFEWTERWLARRRARAWAAPRRDRL